MQRIQGGSSAIVLGQLPAASASQAHNGTPTGTQTRRTDRTCSFRMQGPEASYEIQLLPAGVCKVSCGRPTGIKDPEYSVELSAGCKFCIRVDDMDRRVLQPL